MALVELARFSMGINAEIARTFLESHDIGAVVFDSGMNIAESVPIMIQTRLMVLDEDHDEALQLLKDADLI
jgi:hypothetical protein